MYESQVDFYCKSSTEEEDSFDMEDTQENSAENLHMQSFFERYIISDEVFAHGGQAFVAKGFDLQRQKHVAVKTYMKAHLD